MGGLGEYYASKKPDCARTWVPEVHASLVPTTTSDLFSLRAHKSRAFFSQHCWWRLPQRCALLQYTHTLQPAVAWQAAQQAAASGKMFFSPHLTTPPCSLVAQRGMDAHEA